MAIRIQIVTVLSVELNLCEIAQKQNDSLFFIQTLGRDKKIIIGLDSNFFHFSQILQFFEWKSSPRMSNATIKFDIFEFSGQTRETAIAVLYGQCSFSIIFSFCYQIK